jgi:hypothetical protein
MNRTTNRFLIPYALLRPARFVGILTIALLTASLSAQKASQDTSADLKPNQSTKVTVRGYVRDLACLMKFNGALKPTNDCAITCARAGSPLVIVTNKNVIYTPISESIPDVSQREKLMPFVGQYVEVTGDLYERSGIKAIVIKQIQKTDEAKS